MKRPAFLFIIVAVATLAGFVAGAGWRGTLVDGAGKSTGLAATRSPGAPGSPIAGTSPSAVASGAPDGSAPASAPPQEGTAPGVPDLTGYSAPALVAPLRMLDRRLRTRGARSDGSWLYQASTIPPLLTAGAGPEATDWRLARPNQGAVRGYAGDVSVAPGETIALHLGGSDQRARLDIFRMGLGDAHHVQTIRDVPVTPQSDAPPDPLTARVEDHWPTSYDLHVGSNWRPGVYLIKLTGSSGGQSYIIFVVRSPNPVPLLVIIPMMTYQAYNAEGGASLYRWDGGNHARGFEVSFDRPYLSQYGAGQFFWLDFPLVVWLEDHGYNVGYASDLDLARNPQLLEGVDTLVFAGHSEYWTGGMRDAVETRSSRGTNLGFFGANQAYWQARLTADGTGSPDRTIVCYKDEALDPLTPVDPAAATVRFDDPLVGRPSNTLIGTDYAGIVHGLHDVTVGSGISVFAPDIGLQPGDHLPGLLGGEIDSAPPSFGGILLGTTPTTMSPDNEQANAAMTLWINHWRGRVFDAGTFGYAWGLDPRYVSARPGFPAAPFAQLTARILAWLGAQPDPDAHVLAATTPVRVTFEAVVGSFPTRARAETRLARLVRANAQGYTIEKERAAPATFQVERTFANAAAATAATLQLQAIGLAAAVETDRGPAR